MDVSLLAALEEKISALRSTLTQADAEKYLWTEAQTESVIIDPILVLLGYGPLEAHKQGHDTVTKNIPDYTLLPNTPNKWFLEVKKLDLKLKDAEAHQAVSYAVAQGTEWAVLTNGRAWYFYNAHYPKPLTEKRVFQINDLFNEPDAVSLLSRLSRASMITSGLTQAWAVSRAADIVLQQLQTTNSATRKALRKAVSEELQTQIADKTLGDIMSRLIEQPNEEASSPSSMPDVPEPDDLFSLDYFREHEELVTGQRPITAKLPGSPPQPIKSWSDLVQKTIAAVAPHYGLPLLPLVGSKTGTKYFLNTAPVRADGKPMITVVSINIGDTEVYADMNQSAINTVQGLLLLLEAVGAPSNIVRLKTAPSKSSPE